MPAPTQAPLQRPVPLSAPKDPPETATAGQPQPAATARTRSATAEDIERIEELTLEDFAVDFDKVVLPTKAAGERMTAQKTDTPVESLVSRLREPSLTHMAA